MSTNSRVGRRFSHMSVYVNLDKSLASQVLVNGKIQRIEYEFLPMVCFHCGHYGHLKEVCPEKSMVSSMAKETTSISIKMVIVATGEEHQSFRLWMLVERKSRRKSKDLPNKSTGISAKNTEGSRFKALNSTVSNQDGDLADRNLIVDNQKNKRKDIVACICVMQMCKCSRRFT
ncbi:hypothetical protein Golob_025101 [Gossypium lobatum]|uniref:CCHC-type domain-containing protein n=1 Tax=Gossypium lobatum TaxID=34289 RepID=A0A7J8NDH5_9ROSI|nr:hypothetical protein [Gossypium lobatum]